MRFLGIDTTKKQSYLWLCDGDKCDMCTLPSYEKHSETLLINIDKFLKQNNVKLADMDFLVNVSGPGSFTGIRIGLSTIKAFAYALNKKVINVSVFDLLLEYIKNGILLLQCTSNSLYFCEIRRNKIVQYGVVDYADVQEKINENDVFVLADEQISLPDTYKINVIDNYNAIAFKKMLNLAKDKIFTDNPEPFYIQLSQAERALKDKEVRNEDN